MNKLILFCFIALGIQSCQLIENKVPDEQQLFEERLKSIDWDTVTDYPTISTCDSLVTAEDRKSCFFRYITESVQKKLAQDTPAIDLEKIDTFHIKVRINIDATMIFDVIFPEDATYNTVLIDSIIQKNLSEFPTVEPALKDGIPVSSEFLLPVIIR